MIERIIVGGSKGASVAHSQCQLIYLIADGLIELVRSLSVRHPVQGVVDFSAGQPELNATRFVGHRVLAGREPGAIVTGEQGTYPDQCKKPDDGPQNGLDR